MSISSSHRTDRVLHLRATLLAEGCFYFGLLFNSLLHILSVSSFIVNTSQ